MDSLKNKIIKLSKKAKYKIVDFFIFLKNIFFSKNILNNQTDIDKKLIYSLSKSKIPSLKQVKYIKRYLNSKEIIIINICLVIIFLSTSFLGIKFIKEHLHVVPAIGGEYTEGLLGVPKYINPLYSSASDVDSDISKLIFSSLFKRNKNSELIGDLAENFKIEEEGKMYLIKVRTDVKWHNNDMLTVDDIIFTFNAIKDSHYKSPLRFGFSGVVIEKIDNENIKFILAEPYAAFLELLTFGIIPENLWLEINPESANLAELNLKPIGSGPYKFKSFKKDKSGNIRSYSLILNDEYYGDSPYVEKINYKFFVSIEEAIDSMNNNEIDSISYLPKNASDDLVAKDSLLFHKLNLPQITAIFFNEKNNKALEEIKVKKALAMSINKNEIVSSVFNGEGRTIDSPILPTSFAYNHSSENINFNIENAKKILDETDWKEVEITEEDIIKAKGEKESKNESIRTKALLTLEFGEGKWRAKKDTFLKIYLSTVETNDNIEVINYIKKSWESIGVKTLLSVVSPSQIQAEIIRPRNFEALFYGQVLGNDPDSYAFWHSSQIGDNGFNISNYSNKEVDKLLEDARLTSDKNIRIEKYKKFQEIINEDIPAIFIYSPVYTYVQSKKIKGYDVNNIVLPYDRFNNIEEWYIETGKKIVW